ncbi:MAG: HNH endonuclease [Candidatus Paceibacterota bacterium]
MAIAICKKCKKKFYVKPSWLKKGAGIYCSRKCSDLGRRKGKFAKCDVCKKKIYKSLKDLKRSINKKYFCSRECHLKLLSSIQFGKKHVNWKCGEFTYKNILKKSNVDRVCVLCAKDDERILLVHHIDKNRKNNKISNLSWLCYNCHFLVHHYVNIDKEFKDLVKKLYVNKKV